MKIWSLCNLSHTARRRGGGSARSDVIISDSKILFPKVIQPNVLVCLTQQAYNKFYSTIRPGGLLLTDTRYVKTLRKADAKQVELPMYKTVMEKIGNPIVLNICMLGAIVSLLDIIKAESIMKVIETRIPEKFLDLNRKALNLGISIAKNGD